MKEAETITITVFTDPMMGLSYESEPIRERLQAEYGESLAIRYVMAGLVRDVTDFMTLEERRITETDPEEGIRRYCGRLAQIYKREEPIGGLPIRMEGFCLFDAERRSSYPLNLAYEAAKLTDPKRADQFLYALRRATIAETKQTTKREEILKVVKAAGIHEEEFLKHMEGGSAQEAFQKDLQYVAALGITSLPTYLIQYGERNVLLQSFDYDDFYQTIETLKRNA